MACIGFLLLLLVKYSTAVNQATQVQSSSGVPKYMAALVDLDGIQYCAGVYIRPNWFLTTAQCALKKSVFQIKACQALDSCTCQKQGTRNVTAKDLHVHEDFKFKGKIPVNDIALIYVKNPYTAIGKPLELARDNVIGRVQVFSFGYTSPYDCVRVMHMSVLQVNDHSICEAATTPTTLCTGMSNVPNAEQATPCPGDEGVPMIRNHMVYGVLNRAIRKCVHGGGISYFESVLDHRQRLEDTMKYGVPLK